MRSHCHTRQSWGWSPVGMGYGTWVQTKEETAWLKGDKDLVFFHCLTFLSKFLGLSFFTIMHSVPVLSWKPLAVQPSPQPPRFLQAKGDLSGWSEVSPVLLILQLVKPLTRVQWAGGLWERSGCFRHSEESVSAGCEPKSPLFYGKAFCY